MRIAFLGTGHMGAPMARCLLRAGHAVTAWNRTASRAQPLAADGATPVASAHDAVAQAELIVTMLADGEAVDAVMRDALPSVPAGARWAQMSTIGPDDAERFAREATARDVRFVDAPVLGSVRPATDGTLVILAAGEDADIEACAPAFDAMGARTIKLGAPGEAAKLKLVVNAWLLGMMGALAETITLAEGMGLDPASFLDAIEGGGTGNRYARVKGDAMVARDYETAFPLSLARKDARLMLEAARAGGRSLPMLEAIERVLAAAEEAGFGEADMAAVIEGLGR